MPGQIVFLFLFFLTDLKALISREKSKPHAAQWTFQRISSLLWPVTLPAEEEFLLETSISVCCQGRCVFGRLGCIVCINGLCCKWLVWKRQKEEKLVASNHNEVWKVQCLNMYFDKFFWWKIVIPWFTTRYCYFFLLFTVLTLLFYTRVHQNANNFPFGSGYPLIENGGNSATLCLHEELCAPFKALLGCASAVVHVQPVTVLFRLGCGDGAGVEGRHCESHDYKALAVLVENSPHHCGSDEPGQCLIESHRFTSGCGLV